MNKPEEGNTRQENGLEDCHQLQNQGLHAKRMLTSHVLVTDHYVELQADTEQDKERRRLLHQHNNSKMRSYLNQKEREGS
jgi:hypothetical protein